MKKRNRKRTEMRLIEAAGEIFLAEGYQELGVNKIARHADVNKGLIYRYFGTLEILFKRYIEQQDFWSPYKENIDQILEENKADSGKSLAKKILHEQLEYFYQNKQMQELIRWEITEKNDISRGVSNMREYAGDQMLGLTDAHFGNTQVSFRAVMTLVIGGIYYCVLHDQTNGSKFCGLDINHPDDMRQLHKTMDQIIDWAYQSAVDSKPLQP